MNRRLTQMHADSQRVMLIGGPTHDTPTTITLPETARI